MNLPMIKGKKEYKRQISRFGGLNYTRDFSEGEFSEADGISHIYYPSLSQKRKTTKAEKYTRPSDALLLTKECVADEGALYYDSKKVGELSGGQKTVTAVGNIITVFPDKVYYNTETKEFGDMTAAHVFDEVDVTFSLDSLSVPQYFYRIDSVNEEKQIPANASFNVYSNIEVTDGSITKTNQSTRIIGMIRQGDYTDFECNSNQYRVVIRASLNSDDNYYTFKSELFTVNRITVNNFDDFRVGDVVEISGCTNHTSNNKSLGITGINGRTLSFESGSFTAGDESNVTIKRKIPDFNCACSYENRLWGCEGNTIYASKLGDPFNFFVYDSLSTDSYTIQSNTAGEFTACVPFGSYCLFFKENAVYKLFGSKPSNFQLMKGFGEGIPKGNGSSAAVSDGRLFYCGSTGVYIYCGGTPQLISQKLGNLKLRNAAGGTDGKNYFIAADTDGVRKLFVYDIERGLWSTEGRTTAFKFSYYNGMLYKMCDDGMYIVCDEADEDAQWSVTLCPFDERYFDTKNYTRLHIIAELYDNAWLCAEVKNDRGEWNTALNVYGNEKKHISIPIKRSSSHELTVRLSGKGKCLLESIVREFSVN